MGGGAGDSEFGHFNRSRRVGKTTEFACDVTRKPTKSGAVTLMTGRSQMAVVAT